MRLQKLLGAVVLGASAFLSANAAPFGDDSSYGIQDLEKRAATIPITGVPNNGVRVRMELRVMQQQYPDMYNIYLLGLQDFMASNQSSELSYYQISGIHGRPYIPWDGVTSTGGSSGYGGGYCTHVSNLFLPWHRPYLALYEQELFVHIQNVAATFTGSDLARYQAAAADWRLPYWDWAAEPCSGCNPYPLLVSNQYTSVYTPTGYQTILNPLFRYNFNPISASDMVYSPFAVWNVTKRYPTNWDANATSQNWLVAPEISSNRASFADRLYNLFQNGNFSQFGNEAWITSTTTNADSLESLHDVIHAITGNNGHMTYLDYAGFDPIFFLHHVMVDRAFAMYQIMYPDSYVEPLAAPGSTYTYAAGTVETINSSLTPFHSDTIGTFYTAAEVTNTSTFGYVYPETQNATNASVIAAINSLYGSSSGSSSKKRGASSVSYDWAANIVSQKFQMSGSYAVYLFLGEPPVDSTAWASDTDLVGIHGVFANFADDDNIGMSQMDLKITASLPLTTSLADKVATGTISSLDPTVVEPYLTKVLNWRIKMFDGTTVDAEDVPDLSVTVIGNSVTAAASDEEFPTRGPTISYASITAGKAGGHSAEYWSPSFSTTTYST